MLTPHVRSAWRRFREKRRRSLTARSATVAGSVLALLLTLPGTAVAARGDLDPSFSGDGRVLTDLGGLDQANDVALQSDGRIVSVGSHDGDFALTRHLPDGTPDTGFGADGTVTTPLGPEGLDDQARGVAVQPDGKIVVVGSAWRDYEDCCWFVVARYNPDGSPDRSFDGDGFVFTDFGRPEEAMDVAVRPDGRIVAAGYVGGRAAVARYNPDGSLDRSFDGDGMVTTALSPSLEEGGDLRALALQPDGKIVVGGEVGTTRFDFVVIRYNADGSLDTGFGGDGIERTDFGAYESVEGLAVQPDGRIVAAGHSDDRLAMARYHTNGTLDTGFDGDGRVLTTGAFAEDVVVQPGDGRIVTAGGRSGGGFAVLRYNPDGGLDGGFGSGGRATAGFGGSDVAHGVALQSDGRIVAAGQGGPNTDFALARFLGGAGTPPPPAGANLSVTTTGPSSVDLGDRATYTVRVTNSAASPGSASGVTLGDALSGVQATVVSATAGQGGCTLTSATGATCSLGSLAPGASATVTVVAEPRTTGTLRNAATVTATQTDPAPADNTAAATTGVGNARGCTIVGTSGSDTLTGTGGDDVICALGGNDVVRAGGGRDTVHGDFGDDYADGGLGDDTLYGGPGNDTLTGSSGNDRLVTTDGVARNDTADGGTGFDTCTTDSGDTRVSCP
ncbi:calcium-binding protein [Streptomyces sp. NPDC015139]|uniref:calcium-binding protein n=1 Tax=Streptomyces sp. NPDC015139 TaxID=3364942 RepID=UPI0036FD5E5B